MEVENFGLFLEHTGTESLLWKRRAFIRHGFVNKSGAVAASRLRFHIIGGFYA